MTFEDNKKFWKEFIELYREHSCLWDVNSRDYSNRNARNRAYNALVLKCREKFPTAEKYFVAKKINSLRTSFRRQVRKIQESTDEVVEPTLWYFDLLLFTLDQGELRPGVLPSIHDELGDDITINETDSQQEYIVPDSRNEHDSDVETPYSPGPPEQELAPVLKKRKRQKETVSSTDPHRKDSSSVFGEFVADSLRNLKNKPLQSWVRHQINNVLYEAEQAYFQNPSQFPKNESLNFSIDTSTLPNLQCESKMSDVTNGLKQSAPVNDSVSTLPSRGNPTSKDFEITFKEEPSFSDPLSPSPN